MFSTSVWPAKASNLPSVPSVPRFTAQRFVTPPDAVSQSGMAVPMYFLYEIGIIMAGLLLKEKIAARAKQEAEEAEREAGA